MERRRRGGERIRRSHDCDREARGRTRSRSLRKNYEDNIEAVLRVGEEKVAKARFAALGTSVYPDATFTLRLSYGSVQGWTENGKKIESFTPLSRLFERATGEEPFAVPASWLKVKDKLDLTTKFNLSTNNDIVGGNSGSPLINAKGDIVGLMFDGNIHSISGAYWFDDQLNRSVAVHPAIMRRRWIRFMGRRRCSPSCRRPLKHKSEEALNRLGVGSAARAA